MADWFAAQPMPQTEASCRTSALLRLGLIRADGAREVVFGLWQSFFLWVIRKLL